MDSPRIRITGLAIVACGLLMGLTTLPVAAAGGCSLTAPNAIRVGDPLSITGSGFPATWMVDVSLTLDGGSPDAFTVDSTAGGDIQITLTPEAADIGHTTVVATANSTCSATVEFTVVGATATLPPERTATPGDDSGTGSNGGGTAPRTDSAAPGAAGSDALPPTAWLIGVLSLLIGIAGLVATRPARGH
jgi:hypothetical protein